MPDNRNLIAGRYEVFQHIGQGGMADVFLAVDTILNRQVAIKILRSELGTDAVSVLRFEREAQAATALSHPNIVEIYDVGEYKGHHFIVMEYVPGKTLKETIRKRGGLLTEEAVDIMIQLTDAVAEAHRRGIIHRDLKPQNVIVKSDGTVKILDFGIALAKGAMQLTQANNVMGSVHYLAPELAKGESATPQSDIYALGICFFEMLTGDVPFKADSAVQVALMHMRNEMPSVRKINPSVPQSVENIIIKATAKDPAKRYRSCNEMLEDLRTCLLPQRRNEARLYIAPAVVREEPAETKPRTQSTAKAANRTSSQKRVRQPETDREAADGSRVVHAAVERKPKSSRILTILLVICLVILGISGMYFVLRTTGILEPPVTTVAVPDLVGQTLSDARNTATETGLVLDTNNVAYTLTESTPKGEIIDVDPDAGTEVEKGSRITVTVSSGIGVTIADYTGRKVKDAEADLKQYPYMSVETVSREDGSVAPGTVIAQELMSPGEMFNPEIATSIRLIYAAYPTMVIPGGLNGKPIDEATQELEAMGIQVLTSNLDTSSLTQDEIASLQTGVVISSDPEGGSTYTQDDDSYVTLYYY